MGRLNRQVNKSKKSLNRYLGLSVLLLFLCVAVTTIVVMSRMGIFLHDATGAIPLIPAIAPEEGGSHAEDNTNADIEANTEANTEVITEDNTEVNADGTQSGSQTAESGREQSGKKNNVPEDSKQSITGGSAAGSTQPEPAKKTGFETSGGNRVWTTNTEIEIFRVFYENGEQEITVRSDNDEDKLLAPGTDNAYTFKLQNTGNVALDYVVTIDAYFSPDYIRMPINCRLSRYDGTWIAGDLENYVDVPTLDTVEDQATLGAGKYTYYTLDWNWPFESGDDELDTLFGNLAVDHNLTLTIRITTTATESANPNAGGGISHPKTGDDSTLALWIALAVGSLFIILILIFMRDKDKKGDNNIEAKQ